MRKKFQVSFRGCLSPPSCCLSPWSGYDPAADDNSNELIQFAYSARLAIRCQVWVCKMELAMQGKQDNVALLCYLVAPGSASVCSMDVVHSRSPVEIIWSTTDWLPGQLILLPRGSLVGLQASAE